MPEFIGRPSLPTGLAEATAQLIAKTPTPWTSVAQAAQVPVQGIIERQGEARKAKTAADVEQKKFEQQQTIEKMKLEKGLSMFTKAHADVLSQKHPETDWTPLIGTDVPSNFLGQMIKPSSVSGKDDPERRLTVAELKSYPSLASGAKLKDTEGLKPITPMPSEGKFTETQWVQIDRFTNPNVAPRGSLLGTAGQANARADRALQTLNDPNVAPQQIAGAVVDLAAIMHGGSPDEMEIKQQTYGSLWNDIANLQTYITANPASANTPGIVNKLKKVIQDIKEVDNSIIQKNVDAAESVFKSTISKDPARWKTYKESIVGMTTGISPSKATTVPNKASSKDPLGIF